MTRPEGADRGPPDRRAGASRGIPGCAVISWKPCISSATRTSATWTTTGFLPWPARRIAARATEGQHATVNRLGMKYVRVLEAGNPLQREGVLRAMSEFFERPVLGGRIGNDLEPMLFHGEAAKQVEAALIGRLSDPDPTIRRLALQALVTIRGDRSPELARSVVRRLGDPDASVRTWAATMSREFPLTWLAGQARRGGHRPRRRIAGPADPRRERGRPGPPRPDRAGDRCVAGTSSSSGRLRPFLDDADASVRAAALEALRCVPGLVVRSDRAMTRSRRRSATAEPGSGPPRSSWPSEPGAKFARGVAPPGPRRGTSGGPDRPAGTDRRRAAAPSRSPTDRRGEWRTALRGRRGPGKVAPAHPEARRAHRRRGRRGRPARAGPGRIGQPSASRGRPLAPGLARTIERRRRDRPTGSTSPTSGRGSCRSSTGWPRTARTAWAATARTRSCG